MNDEKRLLNERSLKKQMIFFYRVTKIKKEQNEEPNLINLIQIIFGHKLHVRALANRQMEIYLSCLIAKALS